MPTADAGVQAAPGRPRNGATQSEPLQFTKAERKAAVGAPALASFLESVTSRMGHALQQNEVADLFLDDLAALADEDSAPGNRLENVISEFQSFTHLTYSKSKVVSAVDWMPGEHGAVGVACAARQSFDERLENAGAVGTAAVLVWNFVDPIHPQLVLESPADVMAFRFNPRRPEIVAGGMYNGQVALWDTRKVERRNTDRSRTQDALAAADADHEGAAAGVSVVSTSRLSAVEASHKMAITGLSGYLRIWGLPGRTPAAGCALTRASLRRSQPTGGCASGTTARRGSCRSVARAKRASPSGCPRTSRPSPGLMARATWVRSSSA